MIPEDGPEKESKSRKTTNDREGVFGCPVGSRRIMAVGSRTMACLECHVSGGGRFISGGHLWVDLVDDGQWGPRTSEWGTK